MNPADERMRELLDKWLTSLELHLKYVSLDEASYRSAQPWPEHDRPSRWIIEVARGKARELRDQIDARIQMGDARFSESLELMAFLVNLVGARVERFIPLAEPKADEKPLSKEATGTRPSLPVIPSAPPAEPAAPPVQVATPVAVPPPAPIAPPVVMAPPAPVAPVIVAAPPPPPPPPPPPQATAPHSYPPSTPVLLPDPQALAPQLVRVVAVAPTRIALPVINETTVVRASNSGEQRALRESLEPTREMPIPTGPPPEDPDETIETPRAKHDTRKVTRREAKPRAQSERAAATKESTKDSTKEASAKEIAAMVTADAVRLIVWGRKWHELVELIGRFAGRPSATEIRRILKENRASIEKTADKERSKSKR